MHKQIKSAAQIGNFRNPDLISSFDLHFLKTIISNIVNNYHIIPTKDFVKYISSPDNYYINYDEDILRSCYNIYTC